MAGWTWMSFTGWLVGGLGLSFVLLWLFGRRVLVRRSPRCVRCGYRLDGLEPGTCPECGRTAKRPGEAFALGRRRWIGASGAVLLVAGLALPSVPVARAQGWPAALPMWVQHRLVAHVDNAGLWNRVAIACCNGELPEASADRFREIVLLRMLDPDRDPATAIGAFGVLMTDGTAPGYSREDLLRIVAQGAPAARAYAAQSLPAPLPPEGEEIKLRREAWFAASDAEKRKILEWLVLYPIGDEDIAILRTAFENDPSAAGSVIQRVVSKSPEPVHALIAELLRHERAGVRYAALGVVERWLRDRDAKPPAEIQRIVLDLAEHDPDRLVFHSAYTSVEDLSEDFGPAIGHALASTTDPERFDGLMYAARRKDDPGVLPGLFAAAMQEHRALWQRIDAAEGYRYVHLRTRQTSEMPKFELVYAALVDAIMRGDPEVLLRIGREEHAGRSPEAVVAVLNRAAEAVIEPGGLDGWLATYPGLSGVLRLAVPEAESPRAALALALTWALEDDPESERLLALRARWFPELVPDETPDETDG